MRGRRLTVVVPVALVAWLVVPAAAVARGHRIAFVCELNLCTAKQNGTGKQQLTHERASGSYVGFPKWSPDGTQLAFKRGYGSIVVMDENGRHQRRVVSTSDGVGAPGWTRDGRSVLYTRTSDFSLFRVSAQGGRTHRIRLGSLNHCKDGSYASSVDESSRGVLAYSGAARGYHFGSGTPDNPTIPHFQLFTVPGTGGHPTRLTDDRRFDFDQPEWSPDGRSLVYWAQRDDPFGPGGSGPCDQSSQFYHPGPDFIMVRSGKKVRTLVTSSQQDPLSTPTWSSDARQIAYSRSGTIFRIPAGGGASKKVITGSQPNWGP